MPENASPPPQPAPAEEGNFLDVAMEWNGWSEYGPWIWTGALLLGYALLLHQQPLRYAFGEGWALLREQGNGWVLGITGILSLVIAAGEWWVGGSGNVEEMTAWGFREMEGGASAGTAMIKGGVGVASAVFASVLPGFGPLLETAGLPWLAEWLLAAVGAALGFLGLQMVVLFFTVRTVMPGRKLKFWSLFEAAFRRTLRMWPAALAFSLALPVVGMVSVGDPAGRIMVALFLFGLLVFAFLHPAAAGDSRRRARPIPQGLACWIDRPFSGLWFFLMVVLHGILFGLLQSAATAHVVVGSLGGLFMEFGLAFIRVLIVIWLAASWAVFYTGAFPLKK